MKVLKRMVSIMCAVTMATSCATGLVGAVGGNNKKGGKVVATGAISKQEKAKQKRAEIEKKRMEELKNKLKGKEVKLKEKLEKGKKELEKKLEDKKKVVVSKKANAGLNGKKKEKLENEDKHIFNQLVKIKDLANDRMNNSPNLDLIPNFFDLKGEIEGFIEENSCQKDLNILQKALDAFQKQFNDLDKKWQAETKAENRKNKEKLEKVEKEARQCGYQQGYNDGLKQKGYDDQSNFTYNKLKQVYKMGYNEGYQAGQKERKEQLKRNLKIKK